jgi:hypothetical protein
MNIYDKIVKIQDKIIKETTLNTEQIKNIYLHSKIKKIISSIKREIPEIDEYYIRLTHKFALLLYKKFAKYILDILEIINLIEDIPHIIRGSAGSSLVCYLTKITNIDPIKENICLARFIHELRNLMPDVDFDFPYNLRDKVFNRINNYFPNKMARISNHMMFREKSALRKAIKEVDIENIEWTDELRKKKIVCADPNLSDLVYCGSKNNDDKLQTFRYTQNQRRLETRTKKYNKIIDSTNKEIKINDKTIKELETVLSKYNSKTTNYEKFNDYLKEKNKLNIILFNHYEQFIFRKFKLNRFINTQKSESKMIKNFINKFGKPENTIFVLGDYDKGEYNMKGIEPVICKKFRKIFRNAGFDTYLINEFRTSKLCNCCHNEIDPFLIRESKKPKDKKINKKILIRGLLTHQELKPKCEIIHNRDKNAVQNMLYIVETLKTTGKRPNEYCRLISA